MLTYITYIIYIHTYVYIWYKNGYLWVSDWLEHFFFICLNRLSTVSGNYSCSYRTLINWLAVLQGHTVTHTESPPTPPAARLVLAVSVRAALNIITFQLMFKDRAYCGRQLLLDELQQSVLLFLLTILHSLLLCNHPVSKGRENPVWL